MDKALVSVIVPCYNQAQYLDEALESVYDQTYQNWECIIVNDGSSDDTEKVANQWVRKDKRFKYAIKENGGLPSARNKGITIAAGEYILPLDADDRIEKKYCELAVSVFEKDAKVKVVYCEAERFGSQSGKWELASFSLARLALENMIYCSAFFRKEEWERVGGYDEKMVFGLEDWEFWISILKNGGIVIKLNYLGFYYRIKPGSMALNITTEQRRFSEIHVLEKHFDFVRKNSYDLFNQNLFLEREIKRLENRLKNKKYLIKRIINLVTRIEIFNL